MNRTTILMASVVLSVTCWLAGGCASQDGSPAGLVWRQTDNSLALTKQGNTIWQLNYDKRYDKPYFHPVALADGTVLTDLRPADHPWHRGLWWSWKFLNRLNYWEDDPNTWLAPGRNEIVKAAVTRHKDGAALARLTVSFHPPGKAEVLREERTLKISPVDARGGYYIDWTSVFTAADKDVLLDRTPILGQPQGVVWGGYAGLSVRLAKDATDCVVVDSDRHTYDMEFNNAKARWLDYTFEVGGKPAGIAILDHPLNLRHPSPWYVIIGKDMRYFSPALIYYEPYTLKAGAVLTLRYRIIVHPGRTDAGAMEKEWLGFSKSGKQG